jgi:hypothetical protein
MSFNEQDHKDQPSAALTDDQRRLISEHLEDGNSKNDLAEMVMERMTREELYEILDHIDNVALEEQTEQSK